MSQVIRIPKHLYKRLESHARGFDTPAGVIERILDFYEAKIQYSPETLGKNDQIDITPGSRVSLDKPPSRIARLKSKVYKKHATDWFTRELENDNYTITSPKGMSKTFKLPDVNDKEAIRELTHAVEKFVEEQGGTIGQIKAARKKLTEFGYHITK